VLADDGGKRWRAEGVIEGRPSAFDAELLGNALAEDVAAERAFDLGEATSPWPDEDGPEGDVRPEGDDSGDDQ